MDNLPENNKSNEIVPSNIVTKTLSSSEIQELYPFANTGRRWYVNPNSHAIVDRIIELWFETQGYDFWDNPYPEVEEWSVNRKDGTIEFKYIVNKNQ